jgi:hypothetical protein
MQYVIDYLQSLNIQNINNISNNYFIITGKIFESYIIFVKDNTCIISTYNRETNIIDKKIILYEIDQLIIWNTLLSNNHVKSEFQLIDLVNYLKLLM